MKRKHGMRLLCVASLGVAVLALALASGAARAAGPVVTGDVYGDVTGAPDITSVSVGDNHGIVTLTIYVTGLQPGADTAAIARQVDAALHIDGAEYRLQAGDTAAGPFAGFWKLVDGTWTLLTPTYTFTFATAELGGAHGFTYDVATAATTAGDEVLAGDRAPDEGSWTYWPVTTADWNGGGAVASLPNGTLYLAGDDSLWHQVDATTLAALGYGDAAVTVYADLLPETIGEPIAAILPAAAPAPTVTPVQMPATPVVVKPIIAYPVTVPATPTAGKTFTVRFAVTRSDTGAPLTSGKMICDPSVKGVVIKHVEQFKNGTATMRFTIPKLAKGKTMKVHLTITSGGASATRNVMFHVADR
jgi:hypothetical protein